MPEGWPSFSVQVAHSGRNFHPAAERRAFLCRYWYLDSIPAISRQFGFSRSKTASMLHRTRAKLRTVLEKEGY